jgi:hypothetical protein
MAFHAHIVLTISTKVHISAKHVRIRLFWYAIHHRFLGPNVDILQCISCAGRFGREAHYCRYGAGHELVLDTETRKCYVCETSEGDTWNVCLQCSHKGETCLIVGPSYL